MGTRGCVCLTLTPRQPFAHSVALPSAVAATLPAGAAALEGASCRSCPLLAARVPEGVRARLLPRSAATPQEADSLLPSPPFLPLRRARRWAVGTTSSFLAVAQGGTVFTSLSAGACVAGRPRDIGQIAGRTASSGRDRNHAFAHPTEWANAQAAGILFFRPVVGFCFHSTRVLPKPSARLLGAEASPLALVF